MVGEATGLSVAEVVSLVLSEPAEDEESPDGARTRPQRAIPATQEP